MAIIYTGKTNLVPYYIKEADLNIYSIQELAYFIYHYSILISNSFISKNLILYIDNVLKMPKLSSAINDMYNKKENLAEILSYILSHSNYYTNEEVLTFRNSIITLLDYSENEYINKAGDELFYLKKYEKAIIQYKKIEKEDDNAIIKLAFCYAKLQFYGEAAEKLGDLYKKIKDIEILKQTYFCLKLNSSTDKIYDFEPNIDENILADWEFEIVSNILTARKSSAMKDIEELFLMGGEHLRENVYNTIKVWKEKYRYIG